MTKEDKQLLLQDLCARLPYGVIVTFAGHSGREDCILNSQHLNSTYAIEYLGLKPYLRPISSMTDEEQKEFVQFHCVNICPIIITERLTISNEAKMFDWLNKKMFDYRGLIPRGRAIEVTEENNPYKD